MNLEEANLLDEVRHHWEHWAAHLGLVNWWSHVRMMTPEEVLENPGAALTVTWHPQQYLRAYIGVHPDQGDRVFSLSRSVLHEACHIYLANVSDFMNGTTAAAQHAAIDQLIETECDALSSVVWRLHEQTGCPE